LAVALLDRRPAQRIETDEPQSSTVLRVPEGQEYAGIVDED
jgi:hypothetical protein